MSTRPALTLVAGLFFANASGPLIWTWMHDMMPNDPEQGVLTVGVCITLFYIISQLG